MNDSSSIRREKFSASELLCQGGKVKEKGKERKRSAGKTGKKMRRQGTKFLLPLKIKRTLRCSQDPVYVGYTEVAKEDRE